MIAPGIQAKPVEETIGKGVQASSKLLARRRELGQFLTPLPVARFMASLFTAQWQHLELLDAGAGAGALTRALVDRLCDDPQKPKRISVTAFELDSSLIGALRSILSECHRDCEMAGIEFSSTVCNEDFIEAAVPMIHDKLFASLPARFNAAIVNPPYRKIQSASKARKLLSSVGIETSNLYTGFVALITRLLAKEGELVAITPRSFCNGPYFKPFRSELLESMELKRLHVFESRSAAFNGDDVLQENVIVHAVKREPRWMPVIISTSSGKPGGAVTEREVSWNDVVPSDDPERFIHLLVDDNQTKARSVINRLSSTLVDLGLMVSTGRVVDFRAEPYLRSMPDETTVPLIYPCHFNGGFVHWPKENSRKANAIVNNDATRELLVSSGVYVLVKRFTAKEERRRVVACIYDPHRIHAPLVGFENHLNYFHLRGRGLPVALAKGLAAFLNSTIVDAYFRQFSGHTQVNATDLRSLNYPQNGILEEIGRKIGDPGISQESLDNLIEREIS